MICRLTAKPFAMLPSDIVTRISNTGHGSSGLASPLTPSEAFDSNSHHAEPSPSASEILHSHKDLNSPSKESPLDMNAEENVAGPSKEGEEISKKNPEVRVSSQDFPPSPPLTRTNSVEDSGAAEELDITEHRSREDWHPLKNESSHRESQITASNLDSDAEEGLERRAPSMAALDGEGDSVVDSNGRVLILEDDPEGSRRRGSHLRIEVKQGSPQPWDLVEPPSSGNEKARNPYGTVTSSNKFSTLQDSARGRSLVPKSSYYSGPPGPDAAYGTSPVGQIGVHHPREILRVERDYTGGELIQFAPIYPIELDGRITPTQFLESINAINELLISAHSLRHAILDNVLAVCTLQLSRVLLTSHYEKEMTRLQRLFEELNEEVFNPVGLNLLWPRRVAFLFLEIEYYFPQSGPTYGSFANGVNPQSINQFSFPNTESPPSQDNTPSPNSGEGSSKQSPPEMTDDSGEPALKRKASDEDMDEGPSQKNQHTAAHSTLASGSRRSSTATKRKSSGANPDESRLLKRKEQNRAAQRAFRERKEKHVKDLEDQVAALEAKNEQANNENENLRDLLSRLQSENMTLKQQQQIQQQQSPGVGSSSFTFSVPKNAGSVTSASAALKDPTFQTSMFSSLPRFAYSPPDTKYSNPLDMTSMMSFDPSVLNLLEEPPQPTATASAGQMDFNFGPQNNFEPSNYTTIASNPAFFSLASAFDHASLPNSSPNPSPSPAATSSSNNDHSSFGFDLSSLTAWPTPMSQDVGTLDDLFGGFLNPPMANMDFSFLSGPSSSTSVSPIVHHSNPQFTGHSPSTSASSSPASHGSEPSLFSVRESSSSESDAGHDEPTECPKTRQECTERLANSGPSMFAPVNTSIISKPVSPVSVMDHEKSDMALLQTIACQKGTSSFPTTEVNEHNVEVLSAWRSITRDPSFKECDINSLCKEFTSKARCDGSKVVIEPQGYQGILETLAAQKQQHQKC
ncbi:hypothetical protein D9758_007382 [Tetrapyrgos nigripes]|uniref:Ras modification protein ERF4 n=1 Tax=Tetrapyrgos nigripes TaxID=182062 RepID=A0A8H5GBI0_9AGAR|nr:hypothetical protein D9758_007382 [Tetrapyrgos nigripes]